MTPASALAVDLVAASLASRGVCTQAIRSDSPEVVIPFDSLEQAQAFNGLIIAAQTKLREEREQRGALERLAVFGLVMASVLRTR